MYVFRIIEKKTLKFINGNISNAFTSSELFKISLMTQGQLGEAENKIQQ